MGLKLVLFIDGEETYEKYDYPLSLHIEIVNPLSIYVDLNGLDKSENFPDNIPDLSSINYEYKIIWED